MTFVAVMMGSHSDLKVMQEALDVLSKLRIPFEVKIASAHRTPEFTHQYVRDADKRGCKAFIAAAGLAAHLAGTVAALTIKPVIGVPMEAGPLNGLDALLSTVQMPGGTPVASMAIGKAGARNAAYFAAQLLALSDPQLAQNLQKEREQKVAELLAQNDEVMKGLSV